MRRLAYGHASDAETIDVSKFRGCLEIWYRAESHGVSPRRFEIFDGDYHDLSEMYWKAGSDPRVESRAFL